MNSLLGHNLYMRVTLPLFFITAFLGQSALRAQSTLTPSPLPIRQDFSHIHISPKSDEIFFSIRNFPGSVGGTADEADIFKMKRDAGGNLTGELFIVDVFNTEREDLLFGISADVKLFYKLGQEGMPGANAGPALVVGGSSSGSSRPANDYIRIIRVNDKDAATEGRQVIDGLVDNPKGMEFFVSPNNHLMLVAKPNRINGSKDLHLSHRIDFQHWGPLIKLPEGVNSNADERSVFLAGDQRSLYFASNRANQKEYKLYVSRRTSDNWEDWTEPVLLDEAINDAPVNLELQLSAIDGYGFMLKRRSLDDKPFLYKVDVADEFKPRASTYLEVKVGGASKIRGNRQYTLRIFHEGSGALEGMAFVFRDQESYAFILPSNDSYVLKLFGARDELIREERISFGDDRRSTVVISAAE